MIILEYEARFHDLARNVTVILLTKYVCFCCFVRKLRLLFFVLQLKFWLHLVGLSLCFLITPRLCKRYITISKREVTRDHITRVVSIRAKVAHSLETEVLKAGNLCIYLIKK